jgi:anti-sigma B factor antagonist
MTLRITITEEKDTVIMAPAGRIDSFAIDELQEGFEQVKQTGKSNIILLLKDLQYINSKGTEAFLSFFKWARQEGGMVRLAEVPPNIMDLLNLLGLDGLVMVYPSLPKTAENSKREAPTEEVYERVEPGSEDGLGELMPPERSRMPYVLAGAGLLIFAIILFLFLKPANRPAEPEREVTTKLDAIERKVSQMEDRGKALSQLEARVENLSTSVSNRLAVLDKEVAGLMGELEAMKKKPELVSAPRKEQEPPKSAAYHVVTKGETLYRIALRYKMSVEDLRRLNNLKPGQPLLSGQKLLVKPR